MSPRSARSRSARGSSCTSLETAAAAEATLSALPEGREGTRVKAVGAWVMRLSAFGVKPLVGGIVTPTRSDLDLLTSLIDKFTNSCHSIEANGQEYNFVLFVTPSENYWSWWGPAPHGSDPMKKTQFWHWRKGPKDSIPSNLTSNLHPNSNLLWSTPPNGSP